MSDNKQTAEDERAEAALIDAVVAYGEACGHGDASECGAKMERVEAAIGGLVAALASKPVPDAFPALQALTEAILTRAPADYMRRRIDEAVSVMAAHGWSAPVPWPSDSPLSVALSYAPAQPVREPMSEEVIGVAAESIDSDPAFVAGFEQGVLFSERHHGITKE